MEKSSKVWLIGRGILAVVLTVGFYGLAIGIAILLFLIPYWEVVYFNRLDLRIAIACIVGGGAIIYSIWPRTEKFQAPGPRLTAKKHPKLFKAIKDTADAVNQLAPSEVYLVADMNAFVTERGGGIGRRSRRVMGLGLPLLQTLTITELRGVIAHEFGHFHGGDTALGPWIYKTRNAIIRTIQNLRGQSQIIQMPFVGYGNLFLRLTNMISRQQEYSADRLAAKVAGSKAVISGLEKIEKASFIFTIFFQTEYIPALKAGYVLPIARTLDVFSHSNTLLCAIENEFSNKDQQKSGPYDTHPPITDRIKAISLLPPGSLLQNEQCALSLLEKPDELEDQLLHSMLVDKTQFSQLKKVEWGELLNQAYLPQWKKVATDHASVVKDIKIVDIPQKLKMAKEFLPSIILVGKLIETGTYSSYTDEQARALLATIFVCALINTLDNLGWEIVKEPGEDVICRHNDIEIKPFRLPQEFEQGTTSPQQWHSLCENAEIATISLSEIDQPELTDTAPEKLPA